MGKTIRSIDVVDVEKRRLPSKHYVYVIEVKWSDGSCFTIYRRYSRFFDLQTTLLDTFPVEGGTVDPNKREIPFLPGKIFFGRSQIKDVAMKRLGEINSYCKKLITLPTQIAKCDQVVDFFEVEPDDLDPPKQESDKPARRKLSLKLSLSGLGKSKAPKEKKVEKISKPKKLECYVAVADYQPQENGELTLLPGLTVEVLEKSDTGWWFVNSEDEQGWVPCTYLEPENGAEDKSAPRAELGKEEVFVCITNFEATSHDEISLEKGVAVSVLQKNQDGWFLIRYQGTEGYAPGTCLKKANNAQRISMKEKSRLSGVEIIGSLQDVSTLLNQEKQDESKRDRSPITQKNNKPVTPSVFLKQRSLERGGNFRPPPRKNSVKKIEIPTTMKPLRGIYITVCDFEGSVENGLSYMTGEKVLVKEKNPTGWWFVKTTDKEGWVPASHLEPYRGDPESTSLYELATMEGTGCGVDDDDFDEANSDNSDNYDDDDDDDDDSDEWYAHPDEAVVVPGTLDKHKENVKRPLPKLPSEEEHYEQPDEIVHTSVRKPAASRNLPPPPAPPTAGKKKEEEPKPVTPLSKPFSSSSDNLLKPKLVNSLSKPFSSSSESLIKPKAASPLSKPFSSSSENLVKPETSETQGGKPDLAAVLKAKFESRSGDLHGKSQQGNEESKPGKTPPKPQVPMLPGKLPDLKKPVTSKPDLPTIPNVKPSTQNQDRQSKFSKPLPPSKGKFSLPPKPSSGESTGHKDVMKSALKPVLKSVSPAIQKKASGSSEMPKSPTNNSNSDVETSKPVSSIAARAAAFNKPETPPQTKPKIASKPAKPAKPGLPSKPGIPSKPPVTAKPQVPSKSSQNVSSIANSLTSKLNLQPFQTPSGDQNSNTEQRSGRGNRNQTAFMPKKEETVPKKKEIASCHASTTNTQPSEGGPPGSENLYVAVFGFVAENEGEVNFNEGDELEVLEFGDDWSYIRVWDEEGWAPTSYLEKC